MTRFHIISAGWRIPAAWADECTQSVEQQTYPNYHHWEIHDAYEEHDNGSRELLENAVTNHRTRLWRSTHCGALRNQVDAIRRAQPEPDDVIVLVDLDDQLAHADVLAQLAEIYTDPTVSLTYGSYESVPYAKGCMPATAYPPEIIAARTYREYARTKGRLLFNHLRTFRYSLFSQLEEADFLDMDGRYYSCAGDTAIMLPMMELAGDGVRFIPEVLYRYRSDNPLSDWRRQFKRNSANLRHVFSKPSKYKPEVVAV